MFLAGFYNEYFYYGLLLGALVIVVDGFYVLFFKGAKEFRWFSISSFIYTITIVILIWNIVFLKLETYPDNRCPSDASFNESYSNSTLDEFWVFKMFDACQLLEIIMSVFVLTSCLARWAYPVKMDKLKNEAFLNIIISYITNGADIVDLFGYIDDTDVKFSSSMNMALLGFVSLSIFQFSFDLSTKLRVKKNAKHETGPLARLKRLIFGTDIWAFLFVLLVQDLPFSVLRLSVVVYYDELSKNYTLYFFVVKNIILACCEVYYIGLIMFKEEEKIEVEKEEETQQEKKNAVRVNIKSNYFGDETNV